MLQPAIRSAFGAALLGRGSEVLGFDDEMSRDHNWEPRVLLFLRDDDYARYGEAVERSLGDALPAAIRGLSDSVLAFDPTRSGSGLPSPGDLPEPGSFPTNPAGVRSVPCTALEGVLRADTW